ncbi:amidohydrolase family protein [Mycobacterium palustre]|nr:amidohydrolase family protein [Mycobacterium palustre]MCV7101349.1 amidohydrolase [Mycobacterium palustre]
MGAIDTWCNAFTTEAFDKYWRGAPEIAEVVAWWHMESRLVGRTAGEFVDYMNDSGVDVVLVPSVKMRAYNTGRMIWDVPDQEVAELTAAAPDRIMGLCGINPTEGMDGVRRLERCIRDAKFVGAHLHTYGFGIPLNDRRYYPYYAKCVEMDVPIVMQVGHSAELMPSHLGRPILLDEIALDMPELKIVAAHTGWPWVEELIALAWKHRNIFIGTSAHHPRYWDQDLLRFANGRGRGKVLFGTDFPVVEYGEALQAIEELDLKPDARDLLLGGAARTLFKIG